MVASFCDGHQYFLADTIDINVYRQLMTPWGANVLNVGTYTPALSPAAALPVLDDGSY